MKRKTEGETRKGGKEEGGKEEGEKRKGKLLRARNFFCPSIFGTCRRIPEMHFTAKAGLMTDFVVVLPFPTLLRWGKFGRTVVFFCLCIIMGTVFHFCSKS